MVVFFVCFQHFIFFLLFVFRLELVFRSASYWTEAQILADPGERGPGISQGPRESWVLIEYRCVLPWALPKSAWLRVA